MWAAATDYARLYSHQHFGKRSDATSFPPSFPASVGSLCRELALSHVCGVGAESGALHAE